VFRAVLDPNILISALLSPRGSPARVVSRWLAGHFELVVSETLLTELERALSYPKLRDRVSAEESAALLAFLRRGARLAADPAATAPGSADPADDYLLALAEAERAVLVSGDRHLLALGDRLPIETAGAFLDRLEER
jgi:uncharacterized protein